MTMDPMHKKLLDLKIKRKELKDELEKVEKELSSFENRIVKLINSGVHFKWCWKVYSHRTVVAWKDICTKYMGKAEVNKILDETEQTEYIHIGVQGFDMPLPKRFDLKGEAMKK